MRETTKENLRGVAFLAVSMLLVVAMVLGLLQMATCTGVYPARPCECQCECTP